MTFSWAVPVRDALVLAAGNGDRFQNGTRQSKLLQPFSASRSSCERSTPRGEAGITSFDVVLGYQADSVRARHRARRAARRRRALHLQPRLASRERRLGAGGRAHGFDDRRFALLMGDHCSSRACCSGLLQRAGRGRTNRCSRSIPARRSA